MKDLSNGFGGDGGVFYEKNGVKLSGGAKR
jgi:hypothetical protein